MHQVKRKWITSGEKYIEKIQYNGEEDLVKKTVPTKSKNGMETNM